MYTYIGRPYVYGTVLCSIRVWDTPYASVWDAPYAYGPTYAYGAEQKHTVDLTIYLAPIHGALTPSLSNPLYMIPEEGGHDTDRCITIYITSIWYKPSRQQTILKMRLLIYDYSYGQMICYILSYLICRRNLAVDSRYDSRNNAPHSHTDKHVMINACAFWHKIL